MDTILRTAFVATWMLCISAPAYCQMADAYAAAAQKFDAAAAQCQNPAGAACLRQNAEYMRCTVRALSPSGANCGDQPSCSTSCSVGGVSSSGGNGNAIRGSGLSPAGQIAQSIGTIQQLIQARNAARDARHANEQMQQDSSDNDSQDNSVAEAQAAAAAAQAQRQKINSDAASVLAQANSLSASLNTSYGQSAAPNATSTISSLLDTSPTSSDSASAVTALLDSTGAQMGASVNPSTSMTTPDNQSNQALLQVPQGIPAIASIDGEENTQAESLGPDWHSGIEKLRDKATDWANDKVQDTAIEAMGEVDPLEKGINDSLRSQIGVPETVPNVTLGSMIKDGAINAASDKAADAISDSKDHLACSGATSAVDHWGCMVLLTPSNTLRGYWAEGKLLVDRFGKLMDATNAGLTSTAGQ
jgi:hypothetical protein